MRKLLFLVAFMILALPAAAQAAPTLSYGMTGSAVTALQQALISQGYLAAGNATGRFGPLTLAALKKFQCDKGIVCSGSSHGLYGPRTQAALPSGSSGGSAPAPAGELEFSGWLPYWREASSTQDALAHIDQLDEINPFVYVLQQDGTIQDMAGIADEPWRSLITVAKAKKVRVIPTIMTGSTDILRDILSSPTRRAQLQDDIVSLVNREGFDGIDIDFEGKRAEERDAFSAFLRGLYQKMGKKWVMCTIESRTPIRDLYWDARVPEGAGNYSNDFVQINKYCDRVRFMTYDQQTADRRRNAEAEQVDALYGPVSDVVWVEKAIKEALKTIPARKIVVGLATYGYEWEVTAYADGYTYDLLWSFGPGYATEIAARQGITPTRQFSGELGFSYTPAALARPVGDVQLLPDSGTTSSAGTAAELALALAKAQNSNHSFRYLVWQDAESIKQKIDLARKLGVRGVAVFRIDGGQSPGFWDIFK